MVPVVELSVGSKKLLIPGLDHGCSCCFALWLLNLVDNGTPNLNNFFHHLFHFPRFSCFKAASDFISSNIYQNLLHNTLNHTHAVSKVYLYSIFVPPGAIHVIFNTLYVIWSGNIQAMLTIHSQYYSDIFHLISSSDVRSLPPQSYHVYRACSVFLSHCPYTVVYIDIHWCIYAWYYISHCLDNSSWSLMATRTASSASVTVVGNELRPAAS